MSQSSETLVADLLAQLNLEMVEDNLFRGSSRDLGTHSVFGGQVAGQAMMAAARTVATDRRAHSMHGYFLRPGDMSRDIVYEVESIRDGRSFSARRVQAIQHGRPIFSMIASFQVAEASYVHQVEMPDVTGPDGLDDADILRQKWMSQARGLPDVVRRSLARELAIEMRPVSPYNMLSPDKREAAQHIWFRAKAPLPDDSHLHRGILTYATDFNLLATALLPHGASYFTPSLQMASIDHALWVHRDPQVDDWLLYAMDSPAAQGARGLARGLIFNREGELVASVAQEGLLRRKDAR